MEVRTLVVVVLMRTVAVEVVQDLDDVGIRVGSAERIAGAIEAQNKLVGLMSLF